MANASTRRPTLSVRLTPEDLKLVEALKRRTGIVSDGDLARLSLRALFERLTGAPWEPEAPKTGTDG